MSMTPIERAIRHATAAGRLRSRLRHLAPSARLSRAIGQLADAESRAARDALALALRTPPEPD